MKSQIGNRKTGPERSGAEPNGSGSETWEWEVLPPEVRQKRASLELLFRWLALIMDDFLGFPGTKFRFGLDPIIGLLPGIGDVASAIISALGLVYAARYGVPKILLTRMATNILVNEVVGIVPGLGDAFSFWFKSNVRNYELLRRYSAAPERSRRGDWIFLLAVLTLLFIIACAGLIVSLLVFQAIWHLIFGR